MMKSSIKLNRKSIFSTKNLQNLLLVAKEDLHSNSVVVPSVAVVAAARDLVQLLLSSGLGSDQISKIDCDSTNC